MHRLSLMICTEKKTFSFLALFQTVSHLPHHATPTPAAAKSQSHKKSPAGALTTGGFLVYYT